MTDDKKLELIHKLGHQIWKNGFEEDSEEWREEWNNFKQLHLPKKFNNEDGKISKYHSKENWTKAVETWIDIDLVKKMVAQTVNSLLKKYTVDDHNVLKENIEAYDDNIFSDLKKNLIVKASQKSFSRSFSIKNNESVKSSFLNLFKIFYYHPNLEPELNILTEETIKLPDEELKLDKANLKDIRTTIEYIAQKQFEHFLGKKAMLHEGKKIQNIKIIKDKDLAFPLELQSLKKVFLIKFNDSKIKNFDTMITPIKKKLTDALENRICKKLVPAYKQAKKFDKDFMKNVLIFSGINIKIKELFETEEEYENFLEKLKMLTISLIYCANKEIDHTEGFFLNNESINVLQKNSNPKLFLEAEKSIISRLFNKREQEISFIKPLKAGEKPATHFYKSVLPNYYLFKIENIKELFFAFKTSERTLIRLYKFLCIDHFLYPYHTQNELSHCRTSMNSKISDTQKNFLNLLTAPIQGNGTNTAILFTFYYQIASLGTTAVEYKLQKKSGVMDFRMLVLSSYQSLSKRISGYSSYIEKSDNQTANQQFANHLMDKLNFNESEIKIQPTQIASSIDQLSMEMIICLFMVEGVRNKSVLVLYPHILVKISKGELDFSQALVGDSPMLYMCPEKAAQPGKQLDSKHSNHNKLIASSTTANTTETKRIIKAEISLLDEIGPEKIEQFAMSFWKNPSGHKLQLQQDNQSEQEENDESENNMGFGFND